VVLREGEVYFHGGEEDFTHSSDPYLRKFLA